MMRVWRLTSVCRDIVPKSRTERPRKTKIGTEVAHVTRDSDKGQRSTCSGGGILWRPPAELIIIRTDVVRRRILRWLCHDVGLFVCLFVCGYVRTIERKPLIGWLETWHSSSPQYCVQACWFGFKGQGSGAHGHHFELSSYRWNG